MCELCYHDDRIVLYVNDQCLDGSRKLLIVFLLLKTFSLAQSCIELIHSSCVFSHSSNEIIVFFIYLKID